MCFRSLSTTRHRSEVVEASWRRIPLIFRRTAGFPASTSAQIHGKLDLRLAIRRKPAIRSQGCMEPRSGRMAVEWRLHGWLRIVLHAARAWRRAGHRPRRERIASRKRGCGTIDFRSAIRPRSNGSIRRRFARRAPHAQTRAVPALAMRTKYYRGAWSGGDEYDAEQNNPDQGISRARPSNLG